jgi:hypothetical protein
VLSGEGKGKTFYEKVMFSCGGRLISSFAMIYPTEQRHIFDPVVERIDTFDQEESAGKTPANSATTREAPAVVADLKQTLLRPVPHLLIASPGSGGRM